MYSCSQDFTLRFIVKSISQDVLYVFNVCNTLWKKNSFRVKNLRLHLSTLCRAKQNRHFRITFWNYPLQDITCVFPQPCAAVYHHIKTLTHFSEGGLSLIPAVLLVIVSFGNFVGTKIPSYPKLSKYSSSLNILYFCVPLYPTYFSSNVLAFLLPCVM